MTYMWLGPALVVLTSAYCCDYEHEVALQVEQKKSVKFSS